MTERQYHICHEKGMDNILSMSRAQQLISSPWFYVVYCKACGHVDGVFAQDVFTITPSASCSIPGLDQGVGHPICLCARPKDLSTRGKRRWRTPTSC